MLGFALVILLLLNRANANTQANKSLNNGWVPLTYADVSNQMTNGVLKRNYDVSWNQAVNYFDAITEHAVKIVLPQPGPNKEIFYYSPPDIHALDIPPVNMKSQDKLLPYTHEKETYTNIPDVQNNDKLNKTENEREVTTEITIEHNQRQSKQIDDEDDGDIENLFEKVIKGSQTEATSITSIGKYMNVKKYEVTEPSNVEEFTQETDKNNRGYIFKQRVVAPVNFHLVRNDITNKLYNNLRKYNINSGDSLNNYAVSKSKINNYKTRFNMYRQQVHPVVPVPFRYNSLNHLPVNPLLAVFLSNYGYYTKGSYGPQNDFRNLYGYSASNNIHNNYPFGSYKIFSDTDSFH